MSYEKAAEAAAFIRSKFSGDVSTAIVLGSGLGAFAQQLENAVRIPYGEIPGFVQSTVEGHAGQLVLGEISGAKVLAQQGRFHFYEGYDMEQVILPVRALGLIVVKNNILTDKTSRRASDMQPGGLLPISDDRNCL